LESDGSEETCPASDLILWSKSLNSPKFDRISGSFNSDGRSLTERFTDYLGITEENVFSAMDSYEIPDED
jgi:hypothetical protein